MTTYPIKDGTGSSDNVRCFIVGSDIVPAHALVDSSGNEKGTSGNPVVVSSTAASGAALDGTDGSGITPPTGAVGIRGWLSGIYNNVANLLLLGQGSTTSGQTGALIQGAVTTGAPTYTTAKTNPLSLDTSGNLRTVVGSSALPTGASTAAKQPAIGTAGTPATDVLSVQGLTGMTPLRILLSGGSGGVMDAAGQNATAPANELIVGGQFNTSPTTIASGKVSPLQLDQNGNLLVNMAAGAAAGGTSSSFGSPFPSVGTAIGATDGTNMKQLVVDASGFLKVNIAAGAGSGGTSSTFAAAFPSTGTAIGASDGTNMKQLLVDGSGFLKINLQTAVPAGTNLIGSVTATTSGAIDNPSSTLTRPSSAVTNSVTVSIANPGVFTWTSNPLVNGQTVVLGGSAAPGGFTLGLTYYVVGVSGNTFNLALTRGGTGIQSTSAGTSVTATLNYANPALIASSVTTPTVPSFSIANSAGAIVIPRVRIITNATSGWGGVSLLVRLWSTAPTYTSNNGDGNAYTASGGDNWLADYYVGLTQLGDRAVGAGGVASANTAFIKLASGTSIFWDLQCLTTDARPIVSQTFKLIAEDGN